MPTLGHISRKGAMIPIFIFLLGCVHTERSQEGRLSEDRELIRVEGSIDQKALERNERIVRVSESAGGEGALVILKRGKRDSLPNVLQGTELRKEPSSLGKSNSGSYSERSAPEASPGLDLPDIFDIFTRIL